ncbi:Major facilitator superfamily domain-containing protein 4A [Halotydeus destructor]|nr:Major facilitator superfamily domain-containing protein 4A [Halotydeus destructor]
MADTKFIRMLKTVSLFAAFFTIGMAISIVGPTILELQCALDVPYEQVVNILPVRAIGFGFGSLVVGVLYDKLNPLLTISVTLTTMGICTILTPWSVSLANLLIVACLCTIGGGMMDSTCNVFMLYIWGKQSQSYMQALHFSYGLGGLVAPLLASPFLSVPEELSADPAMANSTVSTQSSCDRKTLKIYIPYAMLGIFAFMLAILFLYLYLYHGDTAEHPSRMVNEVDILEGTKKDSVWPKRIVVAVAAIFLFTMHGLEVGMGSFIASFAVMSDLHLTKQVGAYMTSLYWFMFTFFRLVAILFIERIGAFYNITIELVILVIANIVLVPFGNTVSWCLWLGVAVMGTGVSTIWASLFGLLENHFPVTSGIASFVTVAACFGEAAYPVVMGYAVQFDPQLFLWVIAMCTVFCIFSFVILEILFRRLHV